jgi:hypothetical protein
VDIDIDSRRLCSISFTIELVLSWFVVNEFDSFIWFKINIDGSVIVCIGVVKSFSVVIDDKDDVDDVKSLSEIVDLVGTVNELRVGNKRWYAVIGYKPFWTSSINLSRSNDGQSL